MYFNLTQSGLTPLHLAAQEDKVNVAEILVINEADVNSQTKVKLSQTVQSANPKKLYPYSVFVVFC